MIREEREYLRADSNTEHSIEIDRPATYLISLQTLSSLTPLPPQSSLPIDSILPRLARFARNARFAHEAGLTLLSRGAWGSLQYGGGEISRHGGQQATVTCPAFLTWLSIRAWVG